MKNILIILVIFFFNSCNKKEDNLFTRKEIQNFTKKVLEIPIFENNNIMFVKVERNQFASSNIQSLYNIFKKRHSKSYKNFEDFLFYALNQKITLNKEDFKGRNKVVFTMQKDIEKEYKKSGLDVLLQKYFKKNVNVYNANAIDMSTETLFSLLYIFYTNNYEIYFDDPSGFYTVFLTKPIAEE